MKKGFTLIELLAVIVILAIIALIATPIILNIISDSKEEANKRSIDLYARAVKNAIASYQLKYVITPGTYTSSSDGKILSMEGIEPLTVEYNGSVYCDTIDIYEDGNIYLAGCRVGTDTKEYTYGTRQQLDPGAYDDNNNLVADWDTLVNVYGLKLTENYGTSNAPIFRNEALKNVTKLVIPEGVTIIDDYVFQGCTNLKSIIIPDSVTNIGMFAFSGTGIKSITIPDSVTSISDGVFEGCNDLTNVIIPDSVTNIGMYAFSGTGIKNITIPDSVTSIGYIAFSYCTNLTSITIPNSVTEISDGVFEGCTSLINITIPDSVTIIDAHAFEGCTSLTDVTIPDSVTYIGQYAFSGTGITNITIPDSVTSIGYSAFGGCTSLTNATFNNPNGWTLDNGTSLNLTDPTTNATYLKNTYSSYSWNRS